ncbi:hypothetical protein ABVT39_003655 [Epinephelus coioides]
MGRRLRTLLPAFPEILQPVLPDLQALQHRERKQRERGARHFNLRHRLRDLPELSPGDSVWISDAKTAGIVISKHHSPWSYLVSGPQGTLRRNQLHLVPVPASESRSEAPQETVTESVSPVKHQDAAGLMRTRKSMMLLPLLSPETIAEITFEDEKKGEELQTVSKECLSLQCQTTISGTRRRVRLLQMGCMSHIYQQVNVAPATQKKPGVQLGLGCLELDT